ncbi:hypothetical protein SPB21_02560 [Leptothoe sp. ISB3NOV94-8A]
MLDGLSTVITVIIGIASLVSLVIGVATWYAGAVKKTYAAERSFNHLQNDLRQLSGNVALVLDDAKDRFDAIDRNLEEIKENIEEIKAKRFFR